MIIPKIDRNPDVNLFVEPVPKGMVLMEGKNLQNTARRFKIPFGVASVSKITVGLIIRAEHVAAFREGLARKAARQAVDAARKADRRAE